MGANGSTNPVAEGVKWRLPPGQFKGNDPSYPINDDVYLSGSSAGLRPIACFPTSLFHWRVFGDMPPKNCFLFVKN